MLLPTLWSPASQQATTLPLVDFLGLLVPFLLSGAGVTAVLTISSGVMKWRSERQPRQRVAAIRAASETLALLPADSDAHTAVQAQIKAEASALTASLQPKPAKRWWRVTGALSVTLIVVAAAIALLISVFLAPDTSGPGPRPQPGSGFPWADLLAALIGAGLAAFNLSRAAGARKKGRAKSKRAKP